MAQEFYQGATMYKLVLAIGLLVAGVSVVHTDANAATASKPKYCIIGNGSAAKCKAVPDNYPCAPKKRCAGVSD
jgi:hypothetical protein